VGIKNGGADLANRSGGQRKIWPTLFVAQGGIKYTTARKQNQAFMVQTHSNAKGENGG